MELDGSYPGFPFCLPRMAPLYTRGPPGAHTIFFVAQSSSSGGRHLSSCRNWSPRFRGVFSTPLRPCAVSSPEPLGQQSPAILPALAAPRPPRHVASGCQRPTRGVATVRFTITPTTFFLLSGPMVEVRKTPNRKSPKRRYRMSLQRVGHSSRDGCWRSAATVPTGTREVVLAVPANPKV